MRQLLTNARLICPTQKQDETGWLLIEDGVIADSGTGANGKDITADKVTDCAGQIVGPGFVDMRVQSGYPGAEHLETLDRTRVVLLQAADLSKAGGLSTVVLLPSTIPVMDSQPPEHD